MSILALLASAALAAGGDEPTPDWSHAVLVIDGADFPLAARPAAPQPDTTVAAPRGWLPDGAEVLDVLRVGERVVVALRSADSVMALVGGPPGPTPAWRTTFEGLPLLASDGVALLAPRAPARAASAPSILARLGADVLALTGARGHLVRLDPATGAVRARLDAPFELERGFIGPSVWSSTLCRFGVGECDEADAAALAAARAAFEARAVGWVTAPPVVTQDRVFLVIARAAPGPWLAQRAEHALLELTHDLAPCTLTPLPDDVAPDATAAEGGVVWALAKGGFLAVAATPDPALWSMGPGSHDRRGATRWLSAGAPPAPGRFLVSDRPADPVLFTGAMALRTGRPSVALDDRATLRLPLEVTSLATGRTATAAIHVPLGAPVEAPTTNFQFDGTTYELFGARLGGVVGWREVETKPADDPHGDRLVIVVQDARGTTELMSNAAGWTRLKALAEPAAQRR